MRSAELARLLRYGVTGAGSALTHLAVLVALAEGLHVWPVAASTAGFIASVALSYLLQHGWVFRSVSGHGVAAARFTVVTTVAFGLNTVIVGVGTEALGGHYPVAQAVAFVVIPVVNYTLNSRWTFRGALPVSRDGEPVSRCGGLPVVEGGEPVSRGDQPAGEQNGGTAVTHGPLAR